MNPTEIAGRTRAKTLLRDALLRERFLHLWQRCGRPGLPPEADAIWRRLERRYAEPHRHYHDKHHLAHCLEQLDMAAAQIHQPDAVEMAIWFHDVVNEPGRTDNEPLSAELFRKVAGGLMDRAFIAAVEDLILITTHTREPRDLDHQFICDIDLASFGCPWECFLADSVAVKAEFRGPDEAYYRSKRIFLEALLERPRIFRTEFFNQRYEQQARDNIRRLLELMDAEQA
jgi:predicted metal-dependent HD superfamily phosphohydrolase